MPGRPLLLLAACALLAALQLARALSPAAIARAIQPTTSASPGVLPLATYSLYAYYQQVGDLHKAARAGPLLRKVAAAADVGGKGKTAFLDVVKQIGKKRGQPARRFFQQFAAKIAGETDHVALVDAAAGVERRIVLEPAEPHWHVARAVLRVLACVRDPSDFTCMNVLKEMPRELTMAMELVYYRNRTLERRGREDVRGGDGGGGGGGDDADDGDTDGYYSYELADAWAPFADEYITTVVNVAAEMLSGLRRLSGYRWQQSLGYNGMVLAAAQAVVDFPASLASREDCCSVAEDAAHLAKRLDASAVSCALRLAVQYSTVANTPGQAAKGVQLLDDLIPLLLRVVEGPPAATQDLTLVRDGLAMAFLNRGNIEGSFETATRAYSECVRFAVQAGRGSFQRAETCLGNLKHKGHQFGVSEERIAATEAAMRADFQSGGNAAAAEHDANADEGSDADADVDADADTLSCHSGGGNAGGGSCEAAAEGQEGALTQPHTKTKKKKKKKKKTKKQAPGAATAGAQAVNERHALHGRTKTDVARDYRDVPCLLSYPRSGNHYMRFVIEFITGRPTAGCPSGQNYQAALGRDQVLDWPIATVDFRQEEDFFAHVDMAQPYAVAKYHATPRLWTPDFRPECPVPGWGQDDALACSKLLFLVRDYRECVPRHMPQFETVNLTRSHTDWWFSLIDEYIQFAGPKLLVRYEDLLLHSETVAQRVADFLGPDVVQADKLEYMLGHAAELAAVSRYKGSYNWIAPTSKSKLTHHRDQLSAFERAVLTEAAAASKAKYLAHNLADAAALERTASAMTAAELEWVQSL